MEFFWQEYGSGLPFPPPGDLPDPGIKPLPPALPALVGRFFTTEPPHLTTFQLKKKKFTLIYCLLFHSYTVMRHLPSFQIIPPGEGNDNPLQYSSLESPMGRGVWEATIHGVAKSWI